MMHFGASTQPTPQAQLESIKNKLDPRHSSIQPLNLLTLSTDNFNDLMKEFESVLNYYQSQPRQLHEKIQISWLYLAFSLYIHHWANHLSDKDFKLDAINKMDARFTYFLADVFNEVESSSNGYLNSFPKHLHQKMLHIQSNMFGLVDRLKTNGNCDYQSVLSSFPVSLSSRVLTIARSKAHEPRKVSLSHAEAEMNTMLLALLKDAPILFQPLKGSIAQSYIDPVTGIELDFPLQSAITLETDGAHIGHLTQAGNHSIIHNLKAFSLRETGWIRVGIPASGSAPLVKNIVELFHIPVLNEFLIKHAECAALSREIQHKIISNRAKFDYTAVLFKMDSAVRRVLQERNIEVVLRNANSEEISNIIASYKQLNHKHSLLSSLRHKESNIACKIDLIQADKARLEGRRKELNDESDIQYAMELFGLSMKINNLEKHLSNVEMEYNICRESVLQQEAEVQKYADLVNGFFEAKLPLKKLTEYVEKLRADLDELDRIHFPPEAAGHFMPSFERKRERCEQTTSSVLHSSSNASSSSSGACSSEHYSSDVEYDRGLKRQAV